MNPLRIGAALVFSFGLLHSGEVSAQQGHPLMKDKTGMNWVVPFSAAQTKAKETGRLLLIKPVAFGTSADGGW